MKLLLLFLTALSLVAAAPLRVRLVTGGHSHDPEFYSAFVGDPNFAVTVEPHPRAYQPKSGSWNSACRAKSLIGLGISTAAHFTTSVKTAFAATACRTGAYLDGTVPAAGFRIKAGSIASTCSSFTT